MSSALDIRCFRYLARYSCWVDEIKPKPKGEYHAHSSNRRPSGTEGSRQAGSRGTRSCDRERVERRSRGDQEWWLGRCPHRPLDARRERWTGRWHEVCGATDPLRLRSRHAGSQGRHLQGRGREQRSGGRESPLASDLLGVRQSSWGDHPRTAVGLRRLRLPAHEEGRRERQALEHQGLGNDPRDRHQVAPPTSPVIQPTRHVLGPLACFLFEFERTKNLPPKPDNFSIILN